MVLTSLFATWICKVHFFSFLSKQLDCIMVEVMTFRWKSWAYCWRCFATSSFDKRWGLCSSFGKTRGDWNQLRTMHNKATCYLGRKRGLTSVRHLAIGRWYMELQRVVAICPAIADLHATLEYNAFSTQGFETCSSHKTSTADVSWKYFIRLRRW